MSVLICSGCYNRMPPRLVNNRNVLLTVLEAGSPRSRYQCLVRVHFLVHRRPVIFLLCPHIVEGARELSGVSCIRALIPFMRFHSYDLITSQRPRILISSHRGLGFNIWSWGWRPKHSVYSSKSQTWSKKIGVIVITCCLE